MPHYFDELKKYLRLDKADEDALHLLLPLAKPHFAAITDDFYERLREHPDAMAVFRSEAQVLRLQATLERWMGSLLQGPWDQEYFEKRSRIGKVHVKIELPQHHMFSAMAVVQEHLMNLAWRNLPPSDAKAAVVALQKVTNIDLAIMLESYRTHFIEKLQGFERRKKVKIEGKLERSQALYHSIFESSGAAIVITDANQCVLLFNAMAEKLTGMTRAEVTGKQVHSALVHPLDAEKMQALISTARSGAASAPQILRVVTPTALSKWVRWHSSPISDSTDICLTGIDVTRESKLAIQARRVESLAALGTLAAGLAHEIRNPLNAAQLQLLLVDRAISKAGDAVDTRALSASELVKTELRRLASLVQDFLAYARPTELRITNADVSDLCEVTSMLLEGDAQRAAVVLSTRIQGDVIARVDLERLKQVLINLLRNAIDAAGEGGHVKLVCRRVSQSVLLEVIDGGPGIPENIEIFEPFTTSKDSGTGLGLSIVHRIVTDHEGMIEMHRKDGKTVFSVELPIDGPATSQLRS